MGFSIYIEGKPFKAKWISYLLLSLFLALGIALVIGGIIFSINDKKNSPIMTGIVTSVTAEVDYVNNNQTYYRVETEFNYSLKKHTCINRVNTAKYKVGDKVDIKVNSKFPVNSKIYEKGFKTFMEQNALMIIGSVFTVIGTFSLTFYSIKQWKKAREAKLNQQNFPPAYPN